MLSATEVNLVSSTQRLSDVYGISKFNVVQHLHVDKRIKNCSILPHPTKRLKNFWLTLECVSLGQSIFSHLRTNSPKKINNLLSREMNSHFTQLEAVCHKCCLNHFVHWIFNMEAPDVKECILPERFDKSNANKTN